MQKRYQLLVSIAVAALTLGMTGCSSNNAYTNQQQVSKTTNSAVGGAAAGALVGAAVGNVPGAIIGGAAGGAAAGSAVGYTMDQQEQDVRTQLRSTGVGVSEIEGSNDIILVMPSNIHFQTASAELSPAFKNILNSVAKVMQKYKFSVAEIPGHADSTGSSSYNMQLSGLRAQAVADYLVSQGIDSHRVVPVANGETQPLFSNATSQGRAMNRRVSIVLHTPPSTSIDRIPPVSGNKS